MHKPPKLTPVISITARNGKALSRVLNRGARIQGGTLIKRPGEPMQYRVYPTGPDAA